jgi:hypothetical protein
MADAVVDLSGLQNVDWSKIALPQSVQGIKNDEQFAIKMAEQSAKDEQFRIEQEILRQQILNDFMASGNDSKDNSDESVISNNILIYGAVGLGVLILVVLLLKKKK